MVYFITVFFAHLQFILAKLNHHYSFLTPLLPLYLALPR